MSCRSEHASDHEPRGRSPIMDEIAERIRKEWDRPPVMVSSITSGVRHVSPLQSLIEGLPPGVKVTIVIETDKEPRS